MMRRPGAVLLEVSIAAGIAAVAMIAVAQLMAVAAQQEKAIEQRRQATQEAANALERILTRPWDEITEERLRELLLPAASRQRLTDGVLACQLETFTEEPPSKRIVADVSWQNRAGERERVRLTAWRFQSEKKP